jgi:hypothetical protein
MMQGFDFSSHAVIRRRSASGNFQSIIRDAPSRHSDADSERQRRHEQKHEGKLAHSCAPQTVLAFLKSEHGRPSRKMQ